MNLTTYLIISLFETKIEMYIGFGLSCKYEDSLKYKKLKLIDLPIYEIKKDLGVAIAFIKNNFDHNKNKNILIHCARGVRI